MAMSTNFRYPYPAKMWAIMGQWDSRAPFIYVGTEFTRSDMIRTHIGDKGVTWQQCRIAGDRAIRVLVTPI